MFYGLLAWEAAFFHVSSKVSCPFHAEGRSNLPLLCPTLSISTCPTLSTNHLLHQPALTQTSFKTSSAQTNFSTNQLLQKPRFVPTNFYKPAFTQIIFYKSHLIKQTTFYTNHLLLKPPFTPTSFIQSLLSACKPKARGPAECRRLCNNHSYTHIFPYQPYSILTLTYFNHSHTRD